ncbi:MAG: peptidase A24, partial [Methanolinea sp.]|nr:peptidase A24 [Methanolinea sp.]
HSFGFIMEEVEETGDGGIRRRFLGLAETIRRMVSGEGRVYTKDLRLHPGDYARELALYQKAGSVWISYGIPFMVPITAGLVTAIFFGDILFTLMKILAGV